MNEKVLIGIICGLILIVVGIGSYVMLVPTIEPNIQPGIVDNIFG